MSITDHMPQAVIDVIFGKLESVLYLPLIGLRRFKVVNIDQR